MLEARRTGDTHRWPLALGNTASTGGNWGLTSLEWDIVKVAWWRSVGGSASKLFNIRSLHRGDCRVIQETRTLHAGSDSRRVGHAIGQVHQAGCWTGALRLVLRALVGARARTDSDLLHQAKQVLTITSVVFLTEEVVLF